MKKGKICIILLLLLGLHLSVSAQTVYTEIYPNMKVAIDNETLNVSDYKSKYKGSMLDYTYTKPDGTVVRVAAYQKSSTLEVFEYPPYPAIHLIYKEFYANGKLKQKGVFLPQEQKIGTWMECDTNGNCTMTDLEADRKVIGYNDVLEYMHEEGCYFPDTKDNTWKLSIWHSPANKAWSVRVDKNGHQYKMYTFDSDGQYPVSVTDLTPALNPVPSDDTYKQAQ